jgi:hypothetical protein
VRLRMMWREERKPAKSAKDKLSIRAE